MGMIVGGVISGSFPPTQNENAPNFKVKENQTSAFDTTVAWRSDSYLAAGILGFGFYVLLGITSLPSVSNALSWREFSFVQVSSVRKPSTLKTAPPTLGVGPIKPHQDRSHLHSSIDSRPHFPLRGLKREAVKVSFHLWPHAEPLSGRQ